LLRRDRSADGNISRSVGRLSAVCDQQKDPEQNLRAVIQRILAKSQDAKRDEGR
jgi:hypothetical protein